ncbi:hypothetical protein [Sporanaerobacter acetigenes]|uniref:hypothetical protein n=1 Tax=Sporanaerobacter acetigenes TaxID=165813 RepID=UPI001052F603|nr:hypothetical protein [Sporanaerobacter acetigenes]
MSNKNIYEDNKTFGSIKDIVLKPFKLVGPLWIFIFATIPMLYERLGTSGFIKLIFTTILIVSITININFYLDRKKILKELDNLIKNRDSLTKIHEGLHSENEMLKIKNAQYYFMLSNFALNKSEYVPTTNDVETLLEIASGKESLDE